MAEHTNRLIHETSPYLRQHAHNPVDWYPWGEEALATRAAREQADPPQRRLLRLSLVPRHGARVVRGRSASARLMNEHFVSIKVDREERPDVDHIYMNAVQMLTGRGGWPMTVFLTPDGKPFYGGTYFPPEDRHGMPGFPRVLLGDRPGVSRQARRGAEDRRAAAWTACGRSSATAAVRPADRRGPGARCRCAGWRAPTTRPTAASARRRSFPTRRSSSSSCAPAAPTRRARATSTWSLHTLRADGARRHLRPARRRLPSLLGRRALAGAALREDALRQRPARAALPRGLPADAATTSSRASRARHSTTCCARCAARTAASTRRRTPTARARRASSSSGTPPRSRRLLGDEAAELACRYWDVTEAGNFEHAQHPARARWRSSSSPSSSGASVADVERLLDGKPRAAVRGARATHQAGPRRQDAHRLERADDQRLRARRPRCSTSRATGRSPSMPSRSSKRSCSAATACSAPARTASPSSTATSTTTPSSSPRCSTSSS